MKNSTLLITASVALFLMMGASASLRFAGTNQAGAEFGSNIPGVYMVDYTFPRAASLDYFVLNGMNVFRLPFLWERLQSSLDGPFDPTYLSYIDSTVNYITNTKGVYVILDVHNYARYNNVYFGEDAQGAPTYQQFEDFWQNLASLYKSNPRVIFGLMNEPNTMPYENVYLAMQAGLNGVRASGATNLVLVPGNDWTGVHSWLAGSSAVMGNIVDPLNNFMFEMHQYFDDNFSGNGNCVPTFDPAAVFGPATAWLRSLGRTGFLGEFGIENTPQCLAVLAATMAYLEANADVWEGYTWWAAGPWWGSYKFSLESGVGDAQLAILTTYLPSTAVVQPIVQPSTTAAAVITTHAVTTAAPATTARPAPVTTARAAPVTTASATSASATTARVAPATTARAAPSTTASMAPAVPSTTGHAQPSTTASTTAAVPSTTGHAQPSTTGAAPIVSAPASLSAPSSQACSLGSQVCVGSSQYQTCTNGRTGNYWASSQSCQAGLVCSPFGNNIYCVRP